MFHGSGLLFSCSVQVEHGLIQWGCISDLHQTPWDTALSDKETIDICTEKMASGILEALALSTSQLQQSAVFSWWHVG